MANKPISVEQNAGCAKAIIWVMASAFTLIGLIGTWFAFVTPMLIWQAAKSWSSTEGKITSAEIEAHHGDSTTYSAEFVYEYTVENRLLRNDEYGFFNYSSSIRGYASDLVQKHPVGSKTPVFYDPADPQTSVMNRDISWGILLRLIPLIFALAGIGMFCGLIFWGWGNSKKDISGYASQVPLATQSDGAATTMATQPAGEQARPVLRDDQLDAQFSGPQKLKPTSGKWKNFFASIFFCLFWNGIVSIFVYQVISSGFPIFMTLFMVPFVLIGLALVGAVVYCFMALFNPNIDIALGEGAIPLGGQTDIAWEIQGNVSRFSQLKIWAEGKELATYQQGTDTRTEDNTFLVIEIAEITDPTQMQFGTNTLNIPALTAPSFKSDRNEIKWSIHVKGVIPYWPDVNNTMDFRVRP